MPPPLFACLPCCGKGCIAGSCARNRTLKANEDPAQCAPLGFVQCLKGTVVFTGTFLRVSVKVLKRPPVLTATRAVWLAVTPGVMVR